MPKWYVIQVNTGKEKSIQQQCLKTIDRADLSAVLIPTYSSQFKLKGEWKERRNMLFPGYVFLETDDIEYVMTRLSGIVGMTRMLRLGEAVVPITDSEQKIIERLTGADGNAELSFGVMEGSRIEVTQGPLKGLESQIIKIDRHKRLAWIELHMFGRELTTKIGLEIVKKI